MALPENFSEWEHLQDQVKRWHNKRVDAWFKNQQNDDISSPKASLKHACKIKDEDTADMVILRKFLFEFDAGYAQAVQTPVYGIPVDELQSDVKFRPQVHLHFQERHPFIAERIRPVTGQISFRIMNESSSTYSRAKAEALALKIKQEFADPIFEWKKGKYIYWYRDLARGYKFKIYCVSKAEGKRVTEAVLNLQNQDWYTEYADFVENDRVYPNSQGQVVVYGQSQPKPIERPTVDVRFRYAQLLLHGQRRAVNLVATTECGLRSVIQRVNKV